MHHAVSDKRSDKSERINFDFNSGHFAHAISLCGVAPLWFQVALLVANNTVLAIKPFLKKGGIA